MTGNTTSDKMDNPPIELAASTDPSALGILHLKRYWEKHLLTRLGKLAPGAMLEEWNIDTTMLAVLCLGLEQTIKHIFSFPDLAAFENWILGINGGKLAKEKIDEFNRYILIRSNPIMDGAIEKVLSDADINFWNENGYLIIREAISLQDCEDTITAICNFIEIKRDDPGSWYHHHPSRQGIMVQLFQHPALQKNRLSKKIRMAYDQLWGRKDLWVNTDRVGFNPPETDTWKFPGPRLHWDVSLELPIPFGLQGILYLADTASNQGAFTLVPGFQNKIEAWLEGLPPTADPRKEDFYALGTKPIVANAGDLIIWHQALPHGSSPNPSTLPRFVHYINYAPLDAEVREKWK